MAFQEDILDDSPIPEPNTYDNPVDHTPTESAGSPITAASISSLKEQGGAVGDVLLEIQNRWATLVANAEQLQKFASELNVYAGALRSDSLEAMTYQMETVQKLYVTMEQMRFDLKVEADRRRAEEARHTLTAEAIVQKPQEAIPGKMSVIERIRAARAAKEKKQVEESHLQQINKALKKGL